jgi:phage gp36-like protein
VPQDVKDRYDEAIAFLKDVAAGKAALDQPTGATAQSAAGGVVETQIEEKFSDGNIGGFV